MKKTIALALLLVFCLSIFVGCGLDDGEKGPNIRVALSDFPQTLDPAVVQLNKDVEQILSLLFEPLVTIDEDGKIEKALAENWYYKYDDIYGHNKMYFELKDTAWSDNRPVSADNVIYAWCRILDPAMDSPYASLLYMIKGAREVKSGLGTIDDLGLAAVDDTLLEVTFEDGVEINEDNMELFLRSVANVHLSPCREDIVTRYAKTGDDWAASAGSMVSSGPFRVQAMDMPRARKKDEKDYNEFSGCRLILERNSYYMRNEEDEDALDKYVTPYRITCYYYEGQVAYKDFADEQNLTQEQFQANRFDDGEVKILGLFNKETYDKYKSDAETFKTLNGYEFYFNTVNGVLADAGVRKALASALDRNAFAELIGNGARAATGYVPTGVFDTDRKSDFRAVGGDLFSASGDSAAASGHGSFVISYLIPQNSFTVNNYSYSRGRVDYSKNIYKQFAELAAEQWNKLGYNVTTKGLYYDEFTAALVNRDFDVIGINTNVCSVDAFAYLAPFAKQYSGSSVVISVDEASDDEIFNPHYTNLDNEEYNEYINSILFVTDFDKRAEMLHNAEKMLADLCPAAPVIWYNNSYVAAKGISGIGEDSWFGYYNFNKLSMSDWRAINEQEAEVSEQRTASE